ncbi:MAG: AAA family ATPase [Bacteroidetes bacterium]|nr:AAA family ATPase [Bacteroidota bacterium]
MSAGYNAVTHTNGATSIPKDLTPLNEFKEIIIIFDNDKAGIKGQDKLAKCLKRQFPSITIKTTKWDKSYPDGFDVSDYLIQGNDLNSLIADAQEFQIPHGGYKVMSVNEFVKAGFEHPDPIVRELLQAGGIASIAGTDGVGKSFYALQFAMHCATGIDFLGYEIKRPHKVLFINYELTNGQMLRRMDKMREYITSTYKSRVSLFDNLIVSLMTDEMRLFQDQWDDIEETIDDWNESEVVIIDNLYTSTDKDVSDNNRLQELLGTISHLRSKYEISFLLVNHHIKNFDSTQRLNKDMIRGGKVFTDLCTNVAQLAQSTYGHETKIFKVTKSRDEAETLFVPQLLEFNGIVFENLGAVENETLHYIDPKKKSEFEALRRFGSEGRFSTEEWVDHCTEFLSPPVSERTAKGWLRKLINWGRLKKIEHGLYQVVPMKVL